MYLVPCAAHDEAHVGLGYSDQLDNVIVSEATGLECWQQAVSSGEREKDGRSKCCGQPVTQRVLPIIHWILHVRR